MPVEEAVLELPHARELAVPQLEPALAEHRDRLGQALERRGAHLLHLTMLALQLELLGAVLEDQQQPALGQRLGDDAQMRARDHPGLLDRLGREEPFAPLGLPGREVADVGQSVGLAHPLEHAIELGAVGEPFVLHREQPAERLVAEGEPAIGRELRDPAESRSSIARCASAKRFMPPRSCSNSSISTREARHPPVGSGTSWSLSIRRGAADRRGHGDGLGLLRVARDRGVGERPAQPGALDQLEPARHHILAVLALDRADHRPN